MLTYCYQIVHGGPQDKTTVIAILSAILHLTNVTFDLIDDGSDGVQVKQDHTLASSKLLHLSRSVLLHGHISMISPGHY